MLSAFLGIGQEFRFKRRIFMRRRSARPGAGDGAHGDDAIAGLTRTPG